MAAIPHVQQHFLGPRATPATQVLGAVDALATLGGLLLCVRLFRVQVDGAYLILMLIVLSLTFPGSIPVKRTPSPLATQVISSWCVTVAILLVIGWATLTLGAFDPRVLVAWLLLTPLLRIAAHLAVPGLLTRVLCREQTRRVALIAGTGETALMLAERIRSQPLLGLRVAGFFADAPSTPPTPAGAVLGRLNDLADYARQHRVDLIYIALPLESQPRIAELLHALEDTTASVYLVPDLLVAELIQARIDTIAGMPVVSVCETPFVGLSGLVKRLSDVLFAIVCCTLALPLLLLIAIGVKLTSPGPVIFRQRRYGLDGREIVVYKFRTMTVTEDGAVVRQVVRGDSRVTRFGAFLRRHSLDELPQFINVIQGRMSVVGPRPHAVAHNDAYRRLIRGYMLRHKVKPGITGWAQVNGLRGETDTLDKMEQRIAFDLAYLRQWSLQLDLLIVLRTILVVLRTNDAY